MLNYSRIKKLGIKPERIRALINQIEGQAINGNAIRNEIKVGRLRNVP